MRSSTRRRTRCQWTLLPHDFPPTSAVQCYFRTWRDDGTGKTIHDLLRCSLRESKRRFEDPSLVVLDTQSLHAAAGVPSATTGRDANKKVPGRKRCLAVDVLGLVIAVVVMTASAHDNRAGIALLDKIAADTDSVKKALVDQGFKRTVVQHGATVGIEVDIVERNPDDAGFVPQAKRWAATGGCRRSPAWRSFEAGVRQAFDEVALGQDEDDQHRHDGHGGSGELSVPHLAAVGVGEAGQGLRQREQLW